MAAQQGWWNLTTTVEPSEADLEHIADMIKDGFTEGQIVADGEDETDA